MEIPKEVVSRFWKHVRKTRRCWLWLAYRDRDNYGRFNLPRGLASETGIARNIGAHRFSLILREQRNPRNRVAAHFPTCGNRLCVRHVRFTTVRQNNREISR